MEKEISLNKLGMILIFGILFISGICAETYSSVSNAQTTAFGSSSADYLASQGIQLYGTGIADSCKAGQDFVMQIHPFGCSPTIVTSNLLEEQNVPVFCPIVATQINPLIEIKAIDSMTFSGQYPKEVSGVGFHPAQAAVKSTNSLVNYPILENVGYAVIVLKRNANESSMPDYVSGNLSARIRYNIQNAFGIGDTSFSVPLVSDAEWEDRYKEFSFWNGKGFLKVEDIYENNAVIGIYEDANRKVSGFTLRIGETSGKIYLSSSYCLSNLQLKLDGLENPDTRVRLKIDDDTREVKQGERFLENRCIISSITKQGLTKSVTGRCTDDNGKRTDLNFKVSPKVEIEYNGAKKSVRLGDNLGGSYYIVNIDSSNKNEVSNSNLLVWIAKLNENEIKNYVSGGILNAKGINYYYGFIRNAKDSNYEGDKLRNKDVWRLASGRSISVESKNIVLGGFSSGGESGDIEPFSISPSSNNLNWESSFNTNFLNKINALQEVDFSEKEFDYAQQNVYNGKIKWTFRNVYIGPTISGNPGVFFSQKIFNTNEILKDGYDAYFFKYLLSLDNSQKINVLKNFGEEFIKICSSKKIDTSDCIVSLNKNMEIILSLLEYSDISLTLAQGYSDGIFSFIIGESDKINNRIKSSTSGKSNTEKVWYSIGFAQAYSDADISISFVKSPYDKRNLGYSEYSRYRSLDSAGWNNKPILDPNEIINYDYDGAGEGDSSFELIDNAYNVVTTAVDGWKMSSSLNIPKSSSNANSPASESSGNGFSETDSFSISSQESFNNWLATQKYDSYAKMNNFYELSGKPYSNYVANIFKEYHILYDREINGDTISDKDVLDYCKVFLFNKQSRDIQSQRDCWSEMASWNGAYRKADIYEGEYFYNLGKAKGKDDCDENSDTYYDSLEFEQSIRDAMNQKYAFSLLRGFVEGCTDEYKRQGKKFPLLEAVEYSLPIFRGSSFSLTSSWISINPFNSYDDGSTSSESSGNGFSETDPMGSPQDTISSNYNSAISGYKSVEEQYPNEGQVDKYGTEISGIDKYAEKALKLAIKLAGDFKMISQRSELVSLLLTKYNTKENQLFVSENIKGYFDSDPTSLTTASVYVSNQYRTITFLNVYEPKFEDYGVDVSVNGNEAPLGIQSLTKDAELTFPVTISSTNAPSTTKNLFIVLKDLDEQYATFQTNFQRDTTTITRIKVGESAVIGNYNVVLNKIYLNKLARVSISTNVDRAGTDANISFRIPIEKRAIQLSPNKIDEMIEKLNETYNKWNEKSEELGKVVDGMQKACVATMGVLVVKSLFTGSSAVAAREKTMKDIRGYCQDLITNGKYGSMRDCINKEGEKINEIQKINENIVNTQNTEASSLNNIEDEDKYRNALAKQVAGGDTQNSNTINKAAENKLISSEGLRDLRYCQLLKEQSSTEDYKRSCGTSYENTIKELNENLASIDEANAQKSVLTQAGLDEKSATTYIFADEKSRTGLWAGGQIDSSKIKDSTGSSIGSNKEKTNVQFFSASGNKKYMAILSDAADSNGEYTAQKVCTYNISGDSFNVNTSPENCITDKFGSFKRTGSFATPLSNPQVQYFGTAPDKDFPAIIPFPYPGTQNHGFYVGIRHVTGINSLIRGGASTAAGTAKSYWVCNAGDDGTINFRTDSKDFTGGDVCAQYRLEAGNIVGADSLFGLTQSQTTQLAVKAEQAIREAERKYGSKGSGNILGMPVSFGNAVFDTPQLQCQDFMSPSDCNWLFNLCDPVICPSSRCDFGGTAPVADVIQSGIIGSLLLCFPNFGNPFDGGVAIPVCLSGLKAGIDGYLSIVQAHRDCLIEKKETGATVGICDEVYSVYLCEFFWKEASQFKDIIIPKILDFFSSGSLRQRGGGEYAGGTATWTNAKNSVNYFTKSYASNAYEAFKVKQVNELQNEVCKNSLSGVFPEIGALESMTEASSPAQFHAKFEEIPFTDATIPPTSQYRVFFHIYAGKNSGVNYQVYLREPDAKASIYSVAPIYLVAGGYIGLGKTASETKDFTAPSGYTKLCVRVNNQEECDFKIVSSSYAVDYVTDSIASNQATESDIKTESACISGTNSISSFINPNIESGASEYLNPDIYQKGIVRVCSSQNPGGSTSSRWKQVGICDDSNVKCWIDTDSVKQAIELAGIQNDSLSKISASSLDKQITSEGYLRISEYNSEIDNINKLLAGSSDDLNSAQSKISNLIDNRLDNKEVLFSWQRAELSLLGAIAYDKLARINKGEIEAGKASAVSSTNDIPVSEKGNPVPVLNSEKTGFFVNNAKVTTADSDDEVSFKVDSIGCDSIEYSLYSKDFNWFSSEKLLGSFSDIYPLLNKKLTYGKEYIIKEIICKDSAGGEVSNVPREFKTGWKLEVIQSTIQAQ